MEDTTNNIKDEESENVDSLKSRIRSLELHVAQLRNLIAKRDRGEDEMMSIKDKEEEDVIGNKKSRKFDMNNYAKRHVLFRIAYFGWDYNGYTVQEDSSKTIEYQLIRALMTTRLISSRETANYHRCGRTDKGVSAFHQVISLDVRSNLKKGPGVFKYPGCLLPKDTDDDNDDDDKPEIEYCKILNSNLPNCIQVLGWSPCQQLDFSARFNCVQRSYKYFFPVGNIQYLHRINEAGKKLEGVHDFRNFCKMDVNNGVVEFVRRIFKVSASLIDPQSDEKNPYAMCVLDVVGNAFLWHQIRCIVSVLFKIGQGLEDVSVIDELLDIKSNPRRPQYGMAAEFPLNLFDCQYNDVEWNFEPDALKYSIRQFHELWTQYSVKATMIRQALGVLESIPLDSSEQYEDKNNQATCLLPKCKAKTYTPLMNMLKCPSLEEKIQSSNKRKKIL